jgi:PAS domain S-box-containing protein
MNADISEIESAHNGSSAMLGALRRIAALSILVGALLLALAASNWLPPSLQSIPSRAGPALIALGLILAVSVAAWSVIHRMLPVERNKIMTALLVAAIVAAASFGLWTALRQELDASMRAEATRDVARLEHSIGSALRIGRLALQRMADRLGRIPDPATLHDEFGVQAEDYMRDIPILGGIAWVDANLIVRGEKFRNGPAFNAGALDADGRWASLLHAARDSGSPQISPASKPSDPQPQIYLVFPARQAATTRGYLIATINYRTLFNLVLIPLNTSPSMRILHNGVPLYVQGDDKTAPILIASLPERLGGMKVEVRRKLSSAQNFLPEIMLGGGVALGALLAITLYFASVLRERTRLAETMREDIMLQMAEREHAQELLQETEFELRSVLDSISDAVYMLDREWCFSYLNPHAEKLLGQDKETLIGQNIWQAFPELQGTELDKNYRQAVAQQRSLDFRLFHESSQAWHNLLVHPHPRGLVIYLKDVTERHASEQALRVSESRFRMVARATADAIWDWDLTTDSVWWSEGLHSLFGHPLDTLEPDSRSWVNRIHADDRGSVLAGIHVVMESSAESWDDEYRFQRFDGTYAYVTDRGFLIRDAQGKAIRMVGGMSDVTERRLNQEKLRDSEGHLRAILDTALEGILTIDANGIIITANKSAQQTFGYAAPELVGESVSKLMSDLDRDWHDRYLTRHGVSGLETLLGNRREATGMRRNGSVFPMDISVIDVYRAGRRQFTGFIRDITDRRTAEQALKKTLSDLDERNRELQDFAFVASHDLQEPLRKVRMFSDRLLQEYGPRLDERAREFLQRNTMAGSRMQVLIDDLLAYSRVATRSEKLSPVDLNRLVAVIVDDLEALRVSSGGKVEWANLPTLMANATQMRQLFQNLISNALKFRNPERAPLVQIRAQPCQAQDQTPAWRISISDNGIGFDNAHADRIFAPFQRLHGRSQFEGSGIGLAIVRRIIERHGGTISANATPGQGATFTLELPEQATLVQTAAPLSREH